MSGEAATIPMKFIADEKGLATMEQKLASMRNEIDQLRASGEKLGRTKIDPVFSQQKDIVARWQAANNRSMTANDRIAQAPAIMQTRNVIAQVKAQQAARQAAVELEKQPGLIDAASGAAMRYLAPLALAGAAVKLISNEWNNVIERQQKAGQTAITFEEALGEATLNVGSVMPPEKLASHALKMSAETGVSPATAVSAISLAIKSGGATNEAEAEKLIPAAFVAGKLTPRASPEQLAGTSGAISSVMMLTNASAEQAAGKVMSMQSMSNVEKFGNAMDAFAPSLAAGLATGASDSLATAMAPSLSQALNDISGEQSKLASTKFFLSTQEVFGEQAKAAGRSDVPDFALEQMRKDPELARSFWEGEIINERTGRKFGKPEVGHGAAEPFLRTISGDTSLQGDQKIQAEWKALLEKNQQRSLSLKDSGQFFEDTEEQVRRATPRVRAERAFQSAIEQNRISGDDAMRGISRDKLAELMQSAGASDLAQKVAGFQLDLSSGDSLRETVAVIKGRAAAKRQDSFSYLEQIKTGWNAKPIERVAGESWAETSNRVMSELYPKAKDESAEEAAKRLDNLANVLQMLIDEKKNPPRPFDRKGNVENVQNN